MTTKGRIKDLQDKVDQIVKEELVKERDKNTQKHK
jgi:hypothetical protein